MIDLRPQTVKLTENQNGFKIENIPNVHLVTKKLDDNMVISIPNPDNPNTVLQFLIRGCNTITNEEIWGKNYQKIQNNFTIDKNNQTFSVQTTPKTKIYAVPTTNADGTLTIFAKNPTEKNGYLFNDSFKNQIDAYINFQKWQKPNSVYSKMNTCKREFNDTNPKTNQTYLKTDFWINNIPAKDIICKIKVKENGVWTQENLIKINSKNGDFFNSNFLLIKDNFLLQKHKSDNPNVKFDQFSIGFNPITNANVKRVSSQAIDWEVFKQIFNQAISMNLFENNVESFAKQNDPVVRLQQAAVEIESEENAKTFQQQQITLDWLDDLKINVDHPVLQKPSIQNNLSSIPTTFNQETTNTNLDWNHNDQLTIENNPEDELNQISSKIKRTTIKR